MRMRRQRGARRSIMVADLVHRVRRRRAADEGRLPARVVVARVAARLAVRAAPANDLARCERAHERDGVHCG